MFLNTKHLVAYASEREYLQAVFSRMPAGTAYAFHVWDKEVPEAKVPREATPDDVLVMLSEERHLPTPRVSCRAFFRQHDAGDHGIPIPLGTTNGFPLRDIIPVAVRTYDFSFVGRRRPAREVLSKLSACAKLRGLRGYVSFEPHAYSEYVSILYNSRVSLSPPGWTSAECFRWYESLAAGCRVVSPMMPANYVYQDAPAVFTDSFYAGDVSALADAVLSAVESVDDAAASASRQYWDTRYSPEVVSSLLTKFME